MKIPSALILAAGLALPGLSGLAHAAEPGLPPLATPPTNQQTPGRFVWGDLFSTNPDASARFYGAVFGWSAKTIGTGEKSYIILNAGADPVAGIARGPANPKKADAARWIGYISVPDVDKAASAITTGGGRLIAGPRNVPDRGIHAIAVDAAGGAFGLLRSSSGDPEDYFPETGSWAWIGLFSRDTKASAEFYREALGYTVVEDTRTEQADDYILATNDTARGGINVLPEGSQYQALWVGFVRVADIATPLAAVRAAGGRVLVEPRVTTNDLAIAVAEDPFGAIFGLVTLNTHIAE